MDPSTDLKAQQRKRDRKYLGSGFAAGVVLLFGIGGGWMSIASSNAKADLVRFLACPVGLDPDFCINKTPPKDSPVTIRGGSMIARARHGWAASLENKHYMTAIPYAEFKDGIRVASEDTTEEFIPESDNTSISYSWKITVNRRFGSGQGFVICSDLKNPLPPSGDLCLPPRTHLPYPRTNRNVYLFAQNFANDADPTQDVLSPAVIDDDQPTATKKYRLAFHAVASTDNDYIAKDDAIIIEGMGVRRSFSCKHNACSAWLAKD